MEVCHAQNEIQKGKEDRRPTLSRQTSEKDDRLSLFLSLHEISFEVLVEFDLDVALWLCLGYFSQDQEQNNALQEWQWTSLIRWQGKKR